MKISIITASYNYENYIQETIQSIIDQTYHDWEMIIVDDGSKDNSIEIIQKYCNSDDRIKLYTHENNENKGLSETIQLGLSKAQGEWIIFLESDDILTPDYIEKKLAIINKYGKDISLIFNNCEPFGDKQKISESMQFIEKNNEYLMKLKYPKNMFHHLYTSNKILTFSSVMVKKSSLKHLNYISPIPCLLDWTLWIQLSYTEKFYYLPEKLTKWRLHYDSYISKSTQTSPLQLQTIIYYNLFKQHKDFSIPLYIAYSHIIWLLIVLKRKCKNFIRKSILKKGKQSSNSNRS